MLAFNSRLYSYTKRSKVTGIKFQSGFTILELMIASSVFAVMLLVVAAGVVSFTNTYFKGITNSDTQSVARTIMADLSQAVEFSSADTISTGANFGVKWVCVENTLIAYVVGQQVTDNAPIGSNDQSYQGLLVGTPDTCQQSNPVPATWANALSLPGQSDLSSYPGSPKELLNQHMRLGALDVTKTGSLYAIHVVVIYGDNDLLSSSNPVPSLNSTGWASESCAGQAGSQFCGISNLTTTVDQRL
jgi:prepilin-type N-terminal cleavage/methylation domain-containing protein